MSGKQQSGAMRTAGAIMALAMVLPGCSTSTQHNAGAATSRTQMDDTHQQGPRMMLDEIYASGKPAGFEQLDVSGIVRKYIPAGSKRKTVESLFKESATSRVVESDPDTLVVRDDRGRAMLDPDPRSVLMTFSFDPAGALVDIKAVHLKQQ